MLKEQESVLKTEKELKAELHNKLEMISVKHELEVALNIFNEATGDLVEPAIERYNKALENYERLFGKTQEGEAE